MSISNVLVTGAGGFIGGRVAHRIALGEEYSVTALVHTLGGAGTMRVGRLPVDIEQGSILDSERMSEVLKSCDAVVNCAHGDAEVTVDGTRTLLEATEAQGIDSYIHLSSAVVHGHDASGRITEQTPLAPDTDYAKQKARAEEIVKDWDGSLQPTIFRPCIVYGPHSPWVKTPLREVQQGAVIAGRGVGDVNQVYIDNLVDAILCALEEPTAEGEIFEIADDEPITWREYYESLGQLCDGHPPTQYVTLSELELRKKLRTGRDSIVPPVRLATEILTAPETLQRTATHLQQTPWAPALYRRLPPTLQTAVKDRIATPTDGTPGNDGTAPEPRYEYPPENVALLQSTSGHIDTQKAKTMLDWQPRVSFDEAMEYIAAWARYEELVDGNEAATEQRREPNEDEDENRTQASDSIAVPTDR